MCKVLGKLLIPRCLCAPSSDECLVEQKMCGILLRGVRKRVSSNTRGVIVQATDLTGIINMYIYSNIFFDVRDASIYLCISSCCRVHKGEVIKFYCETCNSALCLPCTFLDHKGHDIEEIKAVREHFSQDVEELVNRVSHQELTVIPRIVPWSHRIPFSSYSLLLYNSPPHTIPWPYIIPCLKLFPVSNNPCVNKLMNRITHHNLSLWTSHPHCIPRLNTW